MAERQVFMLGRDGHMANVTGSAREAGAAAELAASRKEDKYSSIGSAHRGRNLGPMNTSAC